MLFGIETLAQYPQYFASNTETGLPTNEIYNIVQDKKGFIWLGCDAGLFKFDGTRYTAYKCETQNSKSISNLTLSISGKIYCINFQNQIFYLENDTLKELKHRLQNISNIAPDKNEHLYVNHANGISVFNPKTKEWKNRTDITDFTRAVAVNDKNEVYFLCQNGLAKLTGEKIKLYQLPDNTKNVASHFRLLYHQNQAWVFKRDGGVFYTLKNEQLVQIKNQNLSIALQNRKVTNLKSLPDGYLWISTYNGIIRYDSGNNSITIFYPEISFTDMLIDREGNYWFTTLQSGILRVPNLNYVVWNGLNPDIKNEKMQLLATDETSVYFTTLNGTIGRLNTHSNELKTFHTGKNADIECLFYDLHDKHLVFNSQNQSYTLKNDKIIDISFQTNAIKTIVHRAPFYLFGTSLGLYTESNNYWDKISNDWTGQLVWNNQEELLYAATNKGLSEFQYKQNQWVCTNIFLPKTQILSIDLVETTAQVFALTFEGKIYLISKVNKTSLLTKLPDNIKPKKLKQHQNKLFVASNKGVWVYDLTKKQWNNLNSFSGLASENVQDLLVLDGNLWLATGKGLQKIPLDANPEKPLAKVYLKNQKNDITLNYGRSLILYPEASIYASNGNFAYSYRINQNEWLKLPSTIEQIEIQNLPTGNFTIELKAIDHLGRDSENTIIVSGYIIPPFWKTWWFVLVCVMLLGIVVWLVVKKIIVNIRHREQQKTQVVNLQLTALKAQMNPHFIFNVLNSIKSYIYENDKDRATGYLDDFSDLIRRTLEMSDTQYTDLAAELKLIKLYIELEAMMLGGDFLYSIETDNSLDNQLKIPALIIQPYIENAIKHGLRHKKGEKKLHLSLKKSGTYGIQIEISDNGIGRSEAQKINNANMHKNSSFATQAIEKRLALINAQKKLMITSEIIDLYDTNKEATGTKVIIKIQHYQGNESYNY